MKEIEKITNLVQKQENCFAKSEIVEQQKRAHKIYVPSKKS